MTKPCFKWCCFLLLLSISAGLSLPSIFNNGQHNHSILTANVEALSDEEDNNETMYGHCEEETSDCLYFCGNCGTAYYAPGHKGGAYEMSGYCSQCQQPAE